MALAAFALLLYLSPFAPMSVKLAALFIPASAAIVYVFALHRGVVSRLLGRAWCVRLGEASFAFYLVHHAVLIVVQHFFGRVPGAAAFTIALGASLAASLLLFAAVESPLRRAIHCWYAAGLRTRVARAIPGVS
ncbi:MAG: hypothetical protein JOZ24_11280 [Candidatus Eremiobacteraeota bacterium]|nr:hypothetical protein [Candidatus Eremiobacteraeota bacterium]